MRPPCWASENKEKVTIDEFDPESMMRQYTVYSAGSECSETIEFAVVGPGSATAAVLAFSRAELNAAPPDPLSRDENEELLHPSGSGSPDAARTLPVEALAATGNDKPSVSSSGGSLC